MIKKLSTVDITTKTNFVSLIGSKPPNTLAGLQFQLRIYYNDEASQRGHKTSKPYDTEIGLVDPKLVQGDQDVTDVFHSV